MLASLVVRIIVLFYKFSLHYHVILDFLRDIETVILCVHVQLLFTRQNEHQNKNNASLDLFI